MAVLGKEFGAIRGPGGSRVWKGLVTLASGEVTINHGFRTITGFSYAPVSESAAVDEVLTIVVASIPTAGIGIRDADGSSVIKSGNASSTATFFVEVQGF